MGTRNQNSRVRACTQEVLLSTELSPQFLIVGIGRVLHAHPNSLGLEREAEGDSLTKKILEARCSDLQPSTFMMLDPESIIPLQ